MRVKNKRLCGSYTVELAALTPVVIAVLVSSITLVFYFYDKCVLFGSACEGAAAAAEQARCGVLDFGETEGKIEDETAKKLLLLKQVTLTINTKGDIVCSEMSARKGFMEVQAKGTASIRLPEDYIRLCKGIVKDED